MSFVPGSSLLWLQPPSKCVFFMVSFPTPGTGGLSGSLCVLARAMEVWARRRGREKVSAQCSREKGKEKHLSEDNKAESRARQS